jgi:selenocysteine lyase/cysteine desulfurase
VTGAALARAAADFRRGFPMLEHVVHLSSCSLGARSTALDAALDRMLSAMMAGGGAWHDFESEVAGARARFAALIGADPEQVAVVPSASVGAYQAVSTIGMHRRDGVVTTADEFPSLAHVWLAQRPRGARVVFADGGPPPLRSGPDRQAPPDAARHLVADYAAVVDERTALVSVPLVTYAGGVLQPVAEIARHAHAQGARVLVDAYQAVGVLPVDVDELGCDYLVAGALKYLLGLPGIAFLYARAGAPDDVDPSLTGWFGRTDPFAFDPRRLDFPVGARRFETGTVSVPSVYAANAGLDLIAGLDLGEVRRHVTGLIELAAGRLAADGETVRMRADAAAHGAHVGLAVDDPPALTGWLADRGIAVSPRGPLVRLSFHYYNDESDVERLCAAVREFRSRRQVRSR